VLNVSLERSCPPQLRAPLARYLSGEISAEITLMQLVLQLGETASLIPTLEALAAAAPGRLGDLLLLARTNAGNLAQVAAVLETGLLNFPPRGDDPIAAIRSQYDAAVRVAPEASVALYSLGSPAILERATSEIVTRLAEWGLLGRDRIVLDIGCGIGRIERALAPRIGAVTGIDVSPGMIAEARRRCGNLPNVTLETCEGRDLSAFAARSVDLVLAVDSFPHLVAIDLAVAERHVTDAARLLRPGGAFVILNFSYRGDVEADRRDVERLARRSGFMVRRAGTRDFVLWDGVTFLLELRSPRE
jgi:SAM-dependent methyltransferase